MLTMLYASKDYFPDVSHMATVRTSTLLLYHVS